MIDAERVKELTEWVTCFFARLALSPISEREVFISATGENARRLGDIKAILDDYQGLRGSHLMLSMIVDKLQAELAKQAPLIEAVMGANLFPAPTDGRTCIDSHDKIIRAALALRQEKK